MSRPRGCLPISQAGIYTTDTNGTYTYISKDLEYNHTKGTSQGISELYYRFIVGGWRLVVQRTTVGCQLVYDLTYQESRIRYMYVDKYIKSVPIIRQILTAHGLTKGQINHLLHRRRKRPVSCMHEKYHWSCTGLHLGVDRNGEADVSYLGRKKPMRSALSVAKHIIQRSIFILQLFLRRWDDSFGSDMG